MQPFDQTVAALSTPPFKGGVALIRVSGEDAVGIVDAAFRAKSGTPLRDTPARTAVYGNFFVNGESVDDVLVTVFRAPHSYTGEDTVEISLHGSMLIARTVLSELYRLGARAAERGEFTRRALLSGKLSLTEAEAIGELLDAKSQAQIRLFGEGSRTRLSRTLADIYERLALLLSSLYAKIDYPDEDLADLSEEELIEGAEAILRDCLLLLSTYRTGRAIAEGIPTVLLGKPNTGKSSLYNRMCGEDAAIVTEYAGTTRDVLESTVSAGRVLLRLFDTAGVRETSDPVESIGVARTLQTAQNAELVLALFDSSLPMDSEDEALLTLLDSLPATKLAVLNKSDLPCALDATALSKHFDAMISICAKDGSLEELYQWIDRAFTDGSVSLGEDAVLFSARQHAALLRATDALRGAIEALRAHVAIDAASGDLELALGALSEGDGRAVSEEIVSHIFSKFCVGK